MSAKSLSSRFDSLYLTNVSAKTDTHTHIPTHEIDACLPSFTSIGLYAYLQCTFGHDPIDYTKVKEHFGDSGKEIDKDFEHLLKIGLLTKRI
jgi:hypothetical protein